MASKNWNQRGNNYWRSSNASQPTRQQQNVIKHGTCGLFFTAENEKRAIPEAKNLIDFLLAAEQTTEVSHSQQSTISPSAVAAGNGEHSTDEQQKQQSETEPKQKEEDVSDALKTACQQLATQNQHQGGSGGNTNFYGGRGRHPQVRQLETKAKNTLFFVSPQISLENVYSLAERMSKFCLENEAQTRFLAKVIPIEVTCYANMEEILPLLNLMLTNHLAKFSKEESGGGGKDDEKTTQVAEVKSTCSSNLSPTYAIDFKARNTKILQKQKVYDEVTALVKEKSPESKVDLTNPDLLIVVHAIRTVAFLAIVLRYAQNKKYALRRAPPSQIEKADNECGEHAEDGAEEEEEGEEEKQEKDEE